MAKLSEAEMKEVEQITPGTVVHRETRTESIKRVHLAQKALTDHQPLDISAIVPTVESNESVIAQLFLSLAVMASGLVAYPITQNPAWILSIIPGFTLIGLFARTSQSIEHNLNGKFEKLLYRIVLTKKQKSILRKRQEIFKSHNKSIELYQMLVKTTMIEFEKYQTLEIINDLNNPEHDEFICISELSGEPFWVSRREYVDALKKTKPNNPDELNKALTKTLQEKIALLSLDSDAGAAKEVTS